MWGGLHKDVAVPEAEPTKAMQSPLNTVGFGHGRQWLECKACSEYHVPNLLTTTADNCSYDPTHTVMGARVWLTASLHLLMHIRAFACNGAPPIWTPVREKKVVGCPDFKGCSVGK